MKIYPSLISSDLLNIQTTLTSLDDHCDGYHLDIMDDHFVPNLTWGPAFINAIAQATQKPLHVHLMVDNPENWIDRLNLTSKDYFIFHVEALKSQQTKETLIKKIAAKKVIKGVALNPKTTTSSVTNFLELVDHVLVMSVEPGFSGQSFIPEVVAKVVELNHLKKSRQYSFTIGMDGGINLNNIILLAQAGVDAVGIASAIFATPDPVNALKEFYNKIKAF